VFIEARHSMSTGTTIGNVNEDELRARITQSLKATLSMFKDTPKQPFPQEDLSQKIKISTKTQDLYSHVLNQVEIETTPKQTEDTDGVQNPIIEQTLENKKKKKTLPQKRLSSALVLAELTQEQEEEKRSKNILSSSELVQYQDTKSLILQEKRQKREMTAKPDWHAPWKLMRVISGHNGWVRALAVDCSNDKTDRTIKIFDLASGRLKLTLTGHISAIRGLAISDRSPYLFSVGEDKTVRCWDLEQNKCIRSYHGHLSAVYCCALHPTLDVLVTGGRDSSARVWDVRTKSQIHLLSGHTDTVASVISQATEPQVVSGSMDSTIRLWDLKMGTTRAVLTNHKKSVRAMVVHPNEYTFLSASSDHLKKWKCPEGKFLQNFTGHNTIINTVAVNSDGVTMSGGDNGSMHFWDWTTGYNFQKVQTVIINIITSQFAINPIKIVCIFIIILLSSLSIIVVNSILLH
jgi:pleiotropic regulator 1